MSSTLEPPKDDITIGEDYEQPLSHTPSSESGSIINDTQAKSVPGTVVSDPVSLPPDAQLIPSETLSTVTPSVEKTPQQMAEPVIHPQPALPPNECNTIEPLYDKVADKQSTAGEPSPKVNCNKQVNGIF